MNAALLTCMFCLGQIPEVGVVYNANALVSQDWSTGWKKSRAKSEYRRILSLRKGASWTKGTAWLLEVYRNKSTGGSSQHAFQGKYQVFQSEVDTLFLRLSFPRWYRGGGTNPWSADIDYEQKEAIGIKIEIPIDGQTVPKDVLTMIVVEGFWVDTAENPIRRQYKQSFFDALRGYDNEKKVRRSPHFLLNEVVELTPGRIWDNPPGGFAESLPPGFVHRGKSKTPQSPLGFLNYDWFFAEDKLGRILSFRPSSSGLTEGTVWFISSHEPEGSRTSDRYFAARGTYAVSEDKTHEGHVCLSLSFTRMYLGTNERDIEWRVAESREFHPGTVSLEIPLPTYDGTQLEAIITGTPRKISGDLFPEITTDGEVLPMKSSAADASVVLSKIPKLPPGFRLRPPPPDFEKIVREAIVAFKRDNYEAAIKKYTEAINTFPDRARTGSGHGYGTCVYWRGESYHRTKQYEKAIADFSACIQHDPKLIYAYGKRGECYLQKEQYTEALKDATKAIDLSSTAAWSHKFRGYVYWKRFLAKSHKQDFESSIQDYRKALQLASPSEEAVICNAIAWRFATSGFTEHAEEALKYARRACETTKVTGYMLGTLAAAYAANGQFDDAVRLQQKALEAEDYPEAYKPDGRKRLLLYKQGKPYSSLLSKR